MPKYSVTGIMTVSCWTEVEADSPEAAIEAAIERQVASLPAVTFNGYDIKDSWHFDNDGEPFELKAALDE